ncbi:MAG: hypothetical protein DRR08_08505 [Candidatus Parabeggiatoa sp. nov. 2]|nr:MAG: hypothetical protein B6247_23045 [Beggiatoa sp. 4572_84]RKZ61545.1 MAG: hypothetical protein DRR08_08505 [Gammaproteobacteria bacterium]HEC85063.1 hypothetical protein [Thioploca sp.]
MSLFKFRVYCLGACLSVVIALFPVHATADVSQQLRQCERHLQANRLTSGRGGTALACYQEVLKTESTNAEALAGLEKIEARYAKWAKRALDQGKPSKAKQFLASLRLVNPESSTLAELEARLQPTRSSTSASPQQAPASPSESTSQPSESTSQPSESTSQPSEPTPQKKAKITDVGQIYEAINTTECLTWPSPETKEKGGKNGWDSFYPKKDDIGLIVAEMKHCHFEDTTVYILKIEQHYVPISSIGAQVMPEESATE